MSVYNLDMGVPHSTLTHPKSLQRLESGKLFHSVWPNQVCENLLSNSGCFVIKANSDFHILPSNNTQFIVVRHITPRFSSFILIIHSFVYLSCAFKLSSLNSTSGCVIPTHQ